MLLATMGRHRECGCGSILLHSLKQLGMDISLQTASHHAQQWFAKRDFCPVGRGKDMRWKHNPHDLTCIPWRTPVKHRRVNKISTQVSTASLTSVTVPSAPDKRKRFHKSVSSTHVSEASSSSTTVLSLPLSISRDGDRLVKTSMSSGIRHHKTPKVPVAFMDVSACSSGSIRSPSLPTKGRDDKRRRVNKSVSSTHVSAASSTSTAVLCRTAIPSTHVSAASSTSPAVPSRTPRGYGCPHHQPSEESPDIVFNDDDWILVHRVEVSPFSTHNRAWLDGDLYKNRDNPTWVCLHFGDESYEGLAEDNKYMRLKDKSGWVITDGEGKKLRIRLPNSDWKKRAK